MSEVVMVVVVEKPTEGEGHQFESASAESQACLLYRKIKLNILLRQSAVTIIQC